MSKELTGLFEKYLYSALSEQETARFKQLMADMDDSTIENNLSLLWEKYEKPDNRNKEAFLTVSRNLRQLLYPRKQFINYHFFARIAAILLLALLVGVVVNYYTKQQSYQTFAAFNYCIVTEKGERASVVLPDGTKVYLNSGTSLSYPATFGKTDRQVRLSGEAYFEVKTNEVLPFIVETKEIFVKVLGTTFNVYAYPESEWFETSLIEGSLELCTIDGAQTILLKPNQNAHYSCNTGRFSISKTDLRMETAWKRGDLLFRSESIQNVLNQIDMFYGTTTEIEGIYPAKLLTGTFHEDDINQVLRNLQIHYKFTYQKNGNRIFIKFNDKNPDE